MLIDEAYIEFGGTTFLPRLAQHPNVLIGRTFSKAYGLAGLRVGYAVGAGEPEAARRAGTRQANTADASSVPATLQDA